jgi:hypothetical protein
MNGIISVRRMRLTVAAIVCAVAAMTMGAAVAGAAPARPVYNDLNTVPATVNGGRIDEDTYSAAPFEFPFGGIVEFTHRPGIIKNLTADVDSFTCEHGVYQLENCYTARPGKKFSYDLTVSIYEVGPEDKRGGLVTQSTERFKIPYRPTTNTSCPVTPEGKGFGVNCDVGGYLSKVTFKHFFPAAVLPEEAIIVINKTDTDSESDVVNVGEQTAYKEWDEALGPGYEGFIAEPPAEGGIPTVGAIPLPEDAFVKGELVVGGWTGYQPALEVTAKT